VKQLTGLDATFLYLETPTTYGHVSGLSVFERPHADFDPYPAVRAKWASLVGALEPMRRRLVEVPFGLDHPYWIEDPHFDLDYHVRQLRLAVPGRPDQLADQICRIVGRPMDRSRPLWEVYVIDGLEDGTWAMLSKYHHATIDGASGVIMLNLIMDTDPDAPPPGESPAWTPEPVPTQTELLRLALRNLAVNPVKAVRTQMRLVRQLADAAGVRGVSSAATQTAGVIKRVATGGSGDDESRVSVPLTPAPATPWNKAITPHRRFALQSASLEDIKALKNATGGTVNDIVMAISAGALREYLLRHDALPDRPLRALVPVSIRTGQESDPWTNRVSGIVADLPTDCDDPLERVRRCHEAMDAGKRQFDLMPAESIVELADFATPGLVSGAMSLAWRLRLADRMTPPVNLIISNVPGPRQALYFAGSQMRDYFPVSGIGDGMGLNITVHSYLDRLDYGLIADRELVPDLWDMLQLHMDEIDHLLEVAGVRPRPPATRSSTKRSAAKRSAAKRAPVKRSGAKGSTTKRSATKRSAAKRAPATRSAATRASSSS
jgi:WS/DGAT/MGAT family acyltransferase